MSWQDFKDVMRLGANVTTVLTGPLLVFGGAPLLWWAVTEQGKHQQPVYVFLTLVATAVLWIAGYGLVRGVRYTPRLWRTGFWLMFLVLGAVAFHQGDWPLSVRLSCAGIFWFWSGFLCLYNDRH